MIERAPAADALRGIAVLGIFVMNIVSMAMPEAAYTNPAVYGDFTALNYFAWLLLHLFAEMKFITIFSLLFGAGVYWQAESRAASLAMLSPAKAHYRRMFILFVIGMLHAYLIWYGDILVSYALCGLILYPLRRLPVWALLLIGVGLIAMESAINLMVAIGAELLPFARLQEFGAAIGYSPRKIDAELWAYRGTWTDQMSHRVPASLYYQIPIFFTWTLWRTLGVMLIGVVIAKTGGFHGRWPTWAYGLCILSGILIGWPLTITGVLLNEANNWDPYFLYFWGMQPNYWGSLFVALTYVAVVVVLVKKYPAFFSAFIATGRMAFTNYLIQSLLGTFIFYGHGLGYFGYLERSQLLFIALAIGVAQIFLSVLWLSRFPQGPVEFVWRRLAYGRAQPTP